jgi:hypothetical protein
MQVKGKDMKTCKKCGIEQSIDNYYICKNNADGLEHGCKTCRLKSKKHYSKSGQRRATEYRVELSWLNNALSEGCMICGSFDKLVVDHDHECCSTRNKSCGSCVRGILCTKCNIGIGHMDDDIERLLKAVEYLRRTKR